MPRDPKRQRIDASSNKGGGLIINGGFDVAQRGTNITLIATGYGLDRWKHILNGGGAQLNVQQVLSVNPLTKTVSAYRLEPLVLTYTTEQIIEKVGSQLNNRKSTVSFWTTATVAYSTSIQLLDNAGSSLQAITLNVPTGDFKHEFTFNAFAFAKDDNVTVRILEIKETTRLEEFQFEPGDVATEFIPMLPGDELFNCYRYAYASGSLFTRTSLVQINDIFFYLPIPKDMRTAPTFSGVVDTDIKVTDIFGVPITGFTFIYIALQNYIRVTATKTAHGLIDAVLLVQLTGIFDAEFY